MKVSFLTCKCGLRLKLVQKKDRKASTFVCRCGERLSFLGSIVELYCAISEPSRVDIIWMPVPEKEILSA